MNILLAHLQKLLSWSYLTTRFPGDLSRPFFLGWIILGGGAIIFAMVVRLVLSWRTATPPAWARWWRKYATMAATAGFIALILLFFRYERSPLLSARILLFSWLIIVSIWKVKLLYTAWRKVPREVSVWNDKQRIAKYLPKK